MMLKRRLSPQPCGSERRDRLALKPVKVSELRRVRPAVARQGQHHAGADASMPAEINTPAHAARRHDAVWSQRVLALAGAYEMNL
jgi:hypothetical protein